VTLRPWLVVPLLLLAVILGVLVWFAPDETRAPVRISMRAELRSLASAESAYHASTNQYTADLTILRGTGALNGTPPGTELIVDRADSSTWAARAHDTRTKQTCSLGSQAPLVCR